MENLLIDLDREMASTRRLLERYPDGKGTWQPHEKSRTLSELATHVANILNHGATILSTEEMDVATRQPPAAEGLAIAGVAFLHEHLTPIQWLAIGLIIVASIGTVSGEH